MLPFQSFVNLKRKCVCVPERRENLKADERTAAESINAQHDFGCYTAAAQGKEVPSPARQPHLSTLHGVRGEIQLMKRKQRLFL